MAQKVLKQSKKLLSSDFDQFAIAIASRLGLVCALIVVALLALDGLVRFLIYEVHSFGWK
jgi:hypothetical protein